MLTIGYLVAIFSTIRIGEKLLQKMGARKPMLIGCAITATGTSAALFTFLSGVDTSFAPLSDLFLGRTDNVGIRFAAAVALLFNVIMVIIAIIAIAMTVPKDDPRADASPVRAAPAEVLTPPPRRSRACTRAAREHEPRGRTN